MYIGAWIIYLIAALALAVMWWRHTGKLGPGFWRATLRWLVICLLFTPALSMPPADDMAPAIIVLVFGLAEEGWEAAAFGLRPLGAALTFGVAVALVTSIVAKFRAVKKSSRA